ncbi:DUF1616 domain-containing protein [Halorubrum lipolyticum]|uniref:DUF1616 domain-containing protein n=1 Tax=Halorubrum lipolyticum DSM 21995 TaxID=1227482 RepID=M0NQE7_9EURY|nr:DUF1616 domain-containing protein [Halorubrum lipolyticum]EMA58870.1 hypothetical protein C469_12253 [Halorubrum lipolyticum DSM 21995]
MLAADLFAVIASVALLAGVVFTPLGDIRVLAVVIGLPFVLLVPGYALVSAVFPRRGDLAPNSTTEISWVARIVASVAGSGIALTVVGVVLDFTVWGFDRTAIVMGLSVVSIVATGVAWYRRRRLATTDQAGIDFGAVRSTVRTTVIDESAVSVVLTILVVIAAAGAVGVVAEESTGEGSVIELYVLGEDESGELTAEAYPSNVTAGEPITAGVGVGTSRSSFDGYVSVRLERVTVDGDEVTVRESRRLDRIDIQLTPGERTTRRHTVRPSMVGEQLRLTYRLYRTGSDSPLRQVHLWLRVRPS